jgi:hypothetical protein
MHEGDNFLGGFIKFTFFLTVQFIFVFEASTEIRNTGLFKPSGTYSPPAGPSLSNPI